jgi:hypothetical protein
MLALKATIGFLMIILGRQFYGLFVAGVSFILAAYVASNFFHIQSEWNLMVISLVSGVLGVLFTFPFRRIMAGLAGFVAGGYLIINLPAMLGGNIGMLSWPPFVIAGLASTLLVTTLFDLAIILLSSLVGAVLVIQSVNIGSLNPITMFFLLVIFGVVAQVVLLQYGKPTPD